MGKASEGDEGVAAKLPLSRECYPLSLRIETILGNPVLAHGAKVVNGRATFGKDDQRQSDDAND